MKNNILIGLLSLLVAGCGGTSSQEQVGTQSQALVTVSTYTASNVHPTVNIPNEPPAFNLCALQSVRSWFNVGDGWQLVPTSNSSGPYYQMNVNGTDTTSITAGCIPVSSFTHNGQPVYSMQYYTITQDNPAMYSLQGLPWLFSVSAGENVAGAGLWVDALTQPFYDGNAMLIVESGAGPTVASGSAIGFELLDNTLTPIPISSSSLTECTATTNGNLENTVACIPTSQGFCWLNGVDGTQPNHRVGGTLNQALGSWVLTAYDAGNGISMTDEATCLNYAL